MTPDLYQRARDLFLEAIDIDAKDRDAWLTNRCAGDFELLGEVRNLLAHDDPRTLIEPPAKPSSDLGTGRRLLLPPSDIPSMIPPRGLMALGALAVLLPLVICGWVANRTLDQFRDQLRADSLQTLVEAKANSIRAWLAREKSITQSWADSTRVRELLRELDALARSTPESEQVAALVHAEQQKALQDELNTLAGREIRYASWNTRLQTIADWSPNREGVGIGVTPMGAARLTAVFSGTPMVMMLGEKDAITRDYSAVPIKPRLGMLVPVRDDNRQVFAALLVYETGCEEELARFLSLAHPDPETDEDGVAMGGTFVFDRDGLLLFDSPFDEQLRELELIPKGPDSFSAKRLELRDPGVDLTRGGVAPEPMASRPLTKMVRMARAGRPGVDVAGYRDVRGVMVAGAWQWLPEYGMGIGVEVDLDALQPAIWLAQLQQWALLGLSGLCTVIAVGSMLAIRRLRAQISSGSRIGPYCLDKLVGEGGMGRVFKASHELLKRPTAIKLLKPQCVDEKTRARFLREAQLAARLEHPNTVNVYDFGVTREGILYLVMEWIDGVTLDEAVREQGPMEASRSRVILRQIASSLSEAHSVGLIHRDLKPQNVMLCRRSGEDDVVKVLDFGLARDLSATNETATAVGFIAGTPKYMAPERWQPGHVATPAIDIFAFGCIGFWLLTGRTAIQGDALEQIALDAQDPRERRPSAAVDSAQAVEIPKYLDDLIVRCLLYEASQRPSSFGEVIEAMDEV